MGLLDRIGRLGDLLKLLDYVKLDQLPEAVAALTRLPALVKSTDWTNDAEIGGFVDAVLYAARQSVEVTVTPVDDEIVTAISEVATAQRDFIIAALKWTFANPEKSEHEFREAMGDSALAASTSSISVTAIIEIALLVIELWRRWRQ